ncbi:unnamed protein product, partial [Ectocarpus fasciculatus]
MENIFAGSKSCTARSVLCLAAGSSRAIYAFDITLHVSNPMLLLYEIQGVTLNHSSVGRLRLKRVRHASPINLMYTRLLVVVDEGTNSLHSKSKGTNIDVVCASIPRQTRLASPSYIVFFRSS